MIPLGIIAAAATLTALASTPESDSMAAQWTDGAKGGLMAFFVLGMPLLFSIPVWRVGIFARAWRVPPETFVFPRGFIRLCAAMIVGNAAGLLIWAIVRDPRYLWLAGGQTLTGSAFCLGAWLRFRHHPKTEFSLPLWPRR